MPNSYSAGQHLDRVLLVLRITAHAAVLLGAPIIARAFHHGDSMLMQVPSNTYDLGTASNYTEIGFSIRYFSTDGAEHIEYSDPQQDALGNRYTAAYAIYHILTATMWIALIAPLAVGLISKLVCNFCISRKEFAARLAHHYARISSPTLLVASMVMIVPFFLLWLSDLCGPNYLELQYSLHEESSIRNDATTSYDSDDETEYTGTVALVHDEIPASCHIQRTGKVFICCLSFCYPLILMANAWFMMQAANSLDAEIANEKARIILGSNHGPVIKVLDNDVHDEEDDDTATVLEDIETI